MGPGPFTLAPDLKPSAVDLNDRQGGSRADSWLKRIRLVTLHLSIPVELELLADLVGDPAELAVADGHLG